MIYAIMYMTKIYIIAFVFLTVKTQKTINHIIFIHKKGANREKNIACKLKSRRYTLPSSFFAAVHTFYKRKHKELVHEQFHQRILPLRIPYCLRLYRL